METPAPTLVAEIAAPISSAQEAAITWSRPSRILAGVRYFAAAVVRYATNHIICHIPFYFFRHFWYRRVLGWYVGPSASILMGQQVQVGGIRHCGKRVSIGSGTIINSGCMLYTSGGLLIGENVSISPGVWLVTGTHDIEDPEFATMHRPIVIDDHVWIGSRATIIGGVTIGKGAVVMAGAVVTKDVAPYSVVGGTPARVIRTRNLRNPSYALRYRPLFE